MILGEGSSATEPADRLSKLSQSKRALYEALRARQSRDARLAAGAVEVLREGVAAGQDAPTQGMVLIHPVGGGLLCYGELIRALPGSYPVYGLAADAALAAADPPALVALAEHYLRRLANAGLRPPVFAGWSFGGMVAYEMGHTAAAAGAQCAVAVIDAMPGLGPLDASDSAEHSVLRSFATDLVRSSGGDPARLRLPEGCWGLPAVDAMDVLRARLEELGLRIEMTVPDLLQRLRVYAGAAQVLRGYRPRTAGPPPHLVWAQDTAGDVGTLWAQHTATPATSLNVPGDHYSLLRPPVVQRVADVLHKTMIPFLDERSTPQEDVSGGPSVG